MSRHGRKSNAPIRAGHVKVRLARTSEHASGTRRTRQRHHLGFKRFAGRSLRYIVEHEGRWVWSFWMADRFIQVSCARVLEVDDPQRFDFKQVRQAYRIERDREVLKETDSASTEVVYGITSAAAERADAKQFWSGIADIGQWKYQPLYSRS